MDGRAGGDAGVWADNFLYFCDVALLMTLVAVWCESALLVSMPAVGILLPQLLWQVDFPGQLFGLALTGMTEYMFDPHNALFTRGLSFFHFWLPIMLIWLIRLLGYDRRAFITWTLLAWGLMLVCFFWMPAPPVPEDNLNPPVNINYVHGFSDQKAQAWMPALVYLGLLMLVLPTCLFYPTHVLLGRLFPMPLAPTKKTA